MIFADETTKAGQCCAATSISIVKGDILWNGNDISQFCLMLQKSHQVLILNLLDVNFMLHIKF